MPSPECREDVESYFSTRSTGKCILRPCEHSGHQGSTEQFLTGTKEAECPEKLWAKCPGFTQQTGCPGGSRRLGLQAPAVRSETCKAMQEESSKNPRVAQNCFSCLERHTGNSRAIPAKRLQEGHATFLRLSFPIYNMGRLIKEHKEGL